MRFTSYFFAALILPLVAVCDVASAATYIPPDLSAVDIPPPGAPSFMSDVKLHFNKTRNGYKLTATQTSSRFTFNGDPNHAWKGTNGNFRLTAYFDSDLGFTGGNVTLKGLIRGYDGTGDLNTGAGSIKSRTQTLFSSSLLASNFDITHGGLGFKTNFADAKGWAKQFMRVDESVWFYNAANTNFLESLLAHKAFNTRAQAITTVPVPAAAWLFGSGLLSLLVSRRRQLI